MSEWTRTQAAVMGDIQQRLVDLDEKLDTLLRVSCMHPRRIAAHEVGSSIVCEDCKQVVGTVR